jgi:hypothetical protein
MNKEPTLIAVLVVIFIFGIQLLVIESYQTSLFKNNNDDDDNNNNDDDDNNDGKFEAKVCEKLLDSETCKKIEEELKSKTKKLTKEEIQSEQKTKKLTKEEIQAEQIRSRYLEPVDPNQNTINNIEQTNKNTQIGNSEPIQNEIIKSDPNPQNLSSPPPSSPSPPSPINTTDSSSISLSLLNLNTLDQNQLIDAISSKISQLRNFDKNKISQALFDLTKSTAAKGGDVMNSLRQIGTKILQNSSDPLIGKIIGLAQTK